MFRKSLLFLLIANRQHQLRNFVGFERQTAISRLAFRTYQLWLLLRLADNLYFWFLSRSYSTEISSFRRTFVGFGVKVRRSEGVFVWYLWVLGAGVEAKTERWERERG